MSPRSFLLNLCAGLMVGGMLQAAPPPLRNQISLNGVWSVGGEVPCYFGEPEQTQIYERDVTVPPAWTGLMVRIEFRAVNFVAEVIVNGHLLGIHRGGWSPFAFDLPPTIKPGDTFRLRVVVQGADSLRNKEGKQVWPVGGWQKLAGIADDVWLRAYGEIGIEDAFIQTGVQQGTLQVDYTVRNTSGNVRHFKIGGRATSPDAAEEIVFESPLSTVGPGETISLHASVPVTRPTLYWPDQPMQYDLRSRVLEEGKVIDEEVRRFGFREITVVGTQFYWNGVRINLYGDYQAFPDAFYVKSREVHSREAWPRTIVQMQALNIRVLRWHHNPVPDYILDAADEAGLLICAESPNYARAFLVSTDRDTYIRNFNSWAGGWIRAQRNHPAIYLWNATNEMTFTQLGGFQANECIAMGAAIAKWDPTRLVSYDGDADPRKPERIQDSPLVNIHYPEGYNKEPVGGMESWRKLLQPSRPVGSGELLHTKSHDPSIQDILERNKWWLGIWLRGMRYLNFTDVRPAHYWYAIRDLEEGDHTKRVRGENVSNALAPVALFDRGYDDLGIVPFVTGTQAGGVFPALVAGKMEERALVVYNDCFRDMRVTVEVEIRGGSGREFYRERSQLELQVPLGEHRDLACIFPVPGGKGENLSLVLRTYKAGNLTFEEIRNFRIVAGESATGVPLKIQLRSK